MDAVIAAGAAAGLTWAATAAGAAGAAFGPLPGRRGVGVLLTIATGLMGWAAVVGLGLPAWHQAQAQVGTALAPLGFALATVAGAVGVVALRRRLTATGHGPVLGRQLFLVMTLHHLPEGLALGLGVAAASQGDPAALAGAGTLVLAMVVHNAAEGALVAAPLRAEGMGRWAAFRRGQWSGVTEVAGALVGAVAVQAGTAVLPWAMAAAAGAMVAVIVGDLLPEVAAIVRAPRGGIAPPVTA